MPYTTLPQSAVDWALSKVGCACSQAKRTQADIFELKGWIYENEKSVFNKSASEYGAVRRLV